ncbi:flagellar basal body rod protein FlgB [Oceanobacter mangrovi]|uniref:flagellar basal body rod protein FlgB n=1 Tax=Oceanobacter mangrovi TaxID=2862510 RepID=UPI001C8E90FB|nr:flagellar basal body rod protein FlgB [Oceanobacter mangrovi]
MAAINFSNALGVHDEALQLRGKRAEVLANNLANSDTPGFKARDFDFRTALDNAVEQSKVGTSQQTGLAMERTAAGHIAGHGYIEDDLSYRNPMQPAIDGNTVDSQIEQALYARNSLDYNASFEFLSAKFKGLKGAIRGE